MRFASFPNERFPALSAAIAIAVFLPGCKRSEAATSQGSEVFASMCSRCHGATGGGGEPAFAGGPAPRNFHDHAFQLSRTDEQLKMTIKNGLGSGMPAFGSAFDDAQLNALVGHLRSFDLALYEWCQFTGWPVGHALLVDPLTGSLVSSKLWSLDHPQTFTRFRKISEEYRFPPGVGLPGRVLESGYAHWIVDVMKDDNFPRNKSCPTLTLHGAFAFPALIDDEVVAVLEFFSTSAEAPNPEWLELASRVAPLIGRAFKRHPALSHFPKSPSLPTA